MKTKIIVSVSILLLIVGVIFIGNPFDEPTTKSDRTDLGLANPVVMEAAAAEPQMGTLFVEDYEEGLGKLGKPHRLRVVNGKPVTFKL